MQAHGEKLSRVQEQLIASLLTEPTIAKAAAASGVAETTALRWLREPSFQEAYATARKALVEHAIALLQAACGQAVATLCAIMADTDSPSSARVSAARTVLEMATRGADMDDLAARVARLEQEAA